MDAQKIKHYSEKLIEVLETQENDKDNWTITGVKLEKPEPVEEPEVKHKFKVGDRVVVYKGDKDERVGTIIRLPMKSSAIPTKYIIELDKKGLGWNVLRSIYGVNSNNAWCAEEYSLTLLEAEQKKTLEPNKWYDAEDFTVDELKELLPVGTTVLVTKGHDNNRTVDLEEEETKLTEITNIGQRWEMKDTRVGVEADIYWRRYFKIVEEN